jgi:xylulokinase
LGKELLLGIDIGTSGCKLTVFNLEGQVVAGATGTYPTAYPHPGYAEQDAGDWWRSICRELQGLIEKQAFDPHQIRGIGLAGAGWACLPVDLEGNPLRKSMLWLDRRAEGQARRMKEQIGEATLINISGNPVDPAYITPKMLWIKEMEPEIYRRAHKFLQSNAYIAFKLTGEFSQDFSQGYGFHFFNISGGSWNEKIAKELGISIDLTAQLKHCHDIVGVVTVRAAAETGLIAGTPVVAGGLDAACCTLGAGVIHPGQAQEQGGQAGGMSILLNQPLIHPQLILGYHVIPGQWLLQGGSVGGGGTLKWFNEQLGGFEQQQAKVKSKSVFELMSEEAESVKPGSDGLIFLPYMAGERSPLWNSKARGVYFGLSYDKTRAHLIRALMEGVGFSLLHNLATAEEVKAQVKELVSVGGAANSKVWTQIKADITGKIIHVPYSDHATTLGAALLAGVGTGVYKSFAEAVDRTVHIQRTQVPNFQNHAIYQEFYQLYLELYQKLRGSYETLAAITRP